MCIKRTALPLLAIMAASCGGGGGSSVTPATTYRGNAPGDSWTYNVQIDFGVFGTFPGSLTQTLSNDTYNGAPSIRSSQTFVVQMANGPESLTSYAEISPTGQLLAETVNGSLLVVASDTFFVSGTIGPTSASSGTITFTNGVTIALTYNVVGAQEVSTPAGPFATWKANQTSLRSDGTSDTYEQWIAPETGNYVILTDKNITPGGPGYTYTALLASMATVGVSPQKATGQPVVHLLDTAARLLSKTLPR